MRDSTALNRCQWERFGVLGTYERAGREPLAGAQQVVEDGEDDVQVGAVLAVVLEVVLVAPLEHARAFEPTVAGHMHAVVEVFVAGLVADESEGEADGCGQAHEDGEWDEERELQHEGERHGPPGKGQLPGWSVAYHVGRVRLIEAVVDLRVADVEVLYAQDGLVHEPLVDGPFCEAGIDESNREECQPDHDSF